MTYPRAPPPHRTIAVNHLRPYRRPRRVVPAVLPDRVWFNIETSRPRTRISCSSSGSTSRESTGKVYRPECQIVGLPYSGPTQPALNQH